MMSIFLQVPHIYRLASAILQVFSHKRHIHLAEWTMSTICLPSPKLKHAEFQSQHLCEAFLIGCSRWAHPVYRFQYSFLVPHHNLWWRLQAVCLYRHNRFRWGWHYHMVPPIRLIFRFRNRLKHRYCRTCHSHYLTAVNNGKISLDDCPQIPPASSESKDTQRRLPRFPDCSKHDDYQILIFHF